MPTVGIVMGSATDLDVMRPAAEALDEFGISREVRVISAHRAPADAARYAEEAAGRGLQVIIAGAGGAAHLPGVLAASTHGFTADYDVIEMLPAAKAALKPGKNVLAVHCHQTTGGQYIDVGLAAVKE